METGRATSKCVRSKERRHDPNDLLATVYQFLGIDYDAMIPDTSGRPVPSIPDGTPIRELM